MQRCLVFSAIILNYFVLSLPALAILGSEDQKNLADLVSMKQAPEVKSILESAGEMSSSEEQKLLSDLLILASLPGPDCDSEIVHLLGSRLKTPPPVEGAANLSAILTCPGVVSKIFLSLKTTDAKLFAERLLLSIDEESEIQRQEIRNARGETENERKEHMVAAASRLKEIGVNFKWLAKELSTECKKQVKEICESRDHYLSYEKSQRAQYNTFSNLPDMKKLAPDTRKVLKEILLLLYGPFL
jgi:hypothetical protein